MMNKLKFFIIVYFLLFVCEILISLLLLILVDTINFGFDNFYIKKAYYSTGVWNFWRVLFYGIPFIILFYFFSKYIFKLNFGYKPIVFSVFNVLIYILLSVFSKIIWKNTPLPPEDLMFKITCVAIFVVPIFLGLIPFVNRRMEKLLEVIIG